MPIYGTKCIYYFIGEMTIIDALWWKLPGTVIKVKYPNGDPNDYYRGWIEKNIGKQGFDWNWAFVGNDIVENTLTIKLRMGKGYHATMMRLMWS